jgi:hypothetical protein
MPRPPELLWEEEGGIRLRPIALEEKEEAKKEEKNGTKPTGKPEGP